MLRCFIFFTCLFSNLISAQISDFESVDFLKSEINAKKNRGASLSNLPVLAFQLTANLDSEVEKFRAIYMWVCQNISIDASQGDRVIAKRKKYQKDSLAYIEWNKANRKKSLKKLLKQNRTVCTGYAYLVKQLCQLVNIDCYIVDGFGRTTQSNIKSLDFINHSWNVVRLNNKWYLCDATWASGFSLNGVYVPKYNDGYFLTDPVLFAKNHFPFEKKWFLNDSISQLKFKPEPIIYDETLNKQIIPIIPNDLETTIQKNKTISFNLKKLNNQTFQKINLFYYTGKGERKLKIENLKQTSQDLSFTTKLKHRGHYDLHLKIDGIIVGTLKFN